MSAALPDWTKKDLREEIGRHYGPYWQGIPLDAQLVFANLLKGIRDGELRMDIAADIDRDVTRVCFAMTEHPGIFSRLTGALSSGSL